MAFDTPEISNYGGELLYFYEFYWGNSSWFYTSSPVNITIGAQEYTAAAISDGGVTYGGAQPGDFRIECDTELPVVALFRGTPPSENVRVVAMRKHASDAEVTIFFAGKIDNVKRERDSNKAVVLCGAGKKRRSGLRLTWSRTCPHIVYDGQCRASMATFGVAATIGSVSGNGFTVSAAPNGTVGYFDGGMLAWDADGNGTMEYRAIESGSSTTAFTIFGRADGLSAGMNVTMYPGCNRTAQTCQDKFNNLVNYGGIEQMPGESPYGQNIF